MRVSRREQVRGSSRASAVASRSSAAMPRQSFATCSSLILVSRCRWSAVKRPRRGRRLLHSFPLRLHPGPWHLLRKRRLPRSESSGAAEALRLYYSTHRCTNASAPAASRLRPTATAALLNTGGFRKPPFARCSDEVPEVRRRRGQGRCGSWEAVHVAKGRGRRPLTPTVVIGSESSRGPTACSHSSPSLC